MYLRTFILIVLILAGCGKEESRPPAVDLTGNTILWQGYTSENTDLAQKFNETMECLASLNVSRSGEPYVIILKEHFICGGYANAAGCMVFEENTIYMQEIAPVFKHEVIHWATYLGIESEDTIYFTQCQLPDSSVVFP